MSARKIQNKINNLNTLVKIPPRTGEEIHPQGVSLEICNFKSIKLEQLELLGNLKEIMQITELFLGVIESRISHVGLFQYVQESTESVCRGTNEPSLLDLFLTDEETQISDLAYLAPLGRSDHCILAFNFECYLEQTSPSEIFEYAKASFTAMKRDLEDSGWVDDFTLRTTRMDTETSWQLFKNKILELREKYVPCIKNGTPTWSGKRTIAVNQELRQAIKDKKRHHRKWIKSLNRGEEESERKLYKTSRNKVKRLMNQAKRDHEKYICSQANQNPKIFWKHVRSCLKTKVGISPLKSPQHHYY